MCFPKIVRLISFELLGEIHVALLKLIIKDIDDVARTPSSGLGMSQNGAVNPGGGHPEIVEGVTFIQSMYIQFFPDYFNSFRCSLSLSGIHIGFLYT